MLRSVARSAVYHGRRLNSTGSALALVLAAVAAVAAPVPAAAAMPGTDPLAQAAYQPVTQEPTAQPATAPAAAVSPMQAWLDGPGLLTIAGEHLHPALLRRFYAAHGYAPVWTDHQSQAAALLNLVSHADDQGLDPDSFHVAALAKDLSATDRDVLLSDAFLAYGDALARGGMPIEQRDDDEDLQPPPVDVVAQLDAAIASPDPAATLTALAPSSRDYAALRRAYQTYRRIADAGGWPRVDSGGRVEALQQRLAAEGYLPQGYRSESFDATTSAAVRSFQAHHGLGTDGRLNAPTLVELNVPADARAHEIAVNLERVRWLPRTLPATRVWVNIANEQLQLFENDRPVFTTRVVVGEDDKQTPEFSTAITGVLFNPPWNVPASIAAKEILPKISEQPDYLARHHMTMRSNGSVQQEAGPYSALGRLKFEMPDRYDVYLHDTPQRGLFQRVARRLSHGCVRVENPRVLAQMVLQVGPEVVERGIAVGSTNRRALPAPLPVFLVYQTAFAGPDGAIEFRHDPYQRDDEIWQFLHRVKTTPVAQDVAPGQRKG